MKMLFTMMRQVRESRGDCDVARRTMCEAVTRTFVSVGVKVVGDSTVGAVYLRDLRAAISWKRTSKKSTLPSLSSHSLICHSSSPQSTSGSG